MLPATSVPQQALCKPTSSCDSTLSLVEARTPPTTQTRVCAIATISIPLNSEVKVMAHLSQPVQGGNWLLEEAPGKRHAACVARAAVSPQCDQVVVRLLNPRPEPVKVYRGNHIATLEPVEGPIVVAMATGESGTPAQPGKEAQYRKRSRSCCGEWWRRPGLGWRKVRRCLCTSCCWPIPTSSPALGWTWPDWCDRT